MSDPVVVVLADFFVGLCFFVVVHVVSTADISVVRLVAADCLIVGLLCGCCLFFICRSCFCCLFICCSCCLS